LTNKLVAGSQLPPYSSRNSPYDLVVFPLADDLFEHQECTETFT
jgi:hypothetical protein